MAFSFSNLIESVEELNARLRLSPGLAYLADKPEITTDPDLHGTIVNLHDAHGDTGITAVVTEQRPNGSDDSHNKLADGRYKRDRNFYTMVVVKYVRPANASKHNAGYPVGGHDIIVGETEIRRSPRIVL